jgi:hypothetical protein
MLQHPRSITAGAATRLRDGRLDGPHAMSWGTQPGLRPLSRKGSPEPTVQPIRVGGVGPRLTAGMQFDPGQALGCDAAIDGILDGPQRVPRLYDDPLHLRAPVTAVVADESVDDGVKVIERWGKRHAEHDR